jgi:fructose-1,6-bisphosphatase/inositol monophosphatase family enzyme
MLIDGVANVLWQAADQAILPRFRCLDRSEIFEKSPGDVVTVADREAEAIITAALLKMLPGSRVVGEEACAVDGALLRQIDEGCVWLVDPIDGTLNFAAGRRPFSVMVALLQDGEAILSWMLDPVSGELCLAEAGAGATINGTRVPITKDRKDGQLSGILRGFMVPEASALSEASPARIEKLPSLLCAGAEYSAVVRGERDFLVFWGTLPWDHAPGTLFLREAGGAVSRLDGQDYKAASQGVGLIAARTPAILDEILDGFRF